MFSSLSRGSSKIARPHICSTCLSNILAASIPPLDRPAAVRHAPYSTAIDSTQSNDGDQANETVPAAATDPTNPEESPAIRNGRLPSRSNYVRRRLRRREPDSSRLISNSHMTLDALRASLEAEELEETAQPQRSEAISGKGSKESKAKSAKTKLPPSVAARKVASKLTPEAAVSARRVASKLEVRQTASKKTKTKSKKSVQSTSNTSPDDAAEDSSSPTVRRAASDPKSRRGGLSKEPGLKIIRAKGKVPENSREYKKLDGLAKRRQQDVTHSADRKRLVTAIQDGNLSEQERREVLRILRASLLTTMTSSKESRNTRTSATHRSLKDAMLRPNPRAPYQPVQRVGIEVPYVVGSPRAGNTPPIAREPPGPIETALAPKFLRGSMTAHEIETVKADNLELIPIDSGPLNVPKLAYGLERVLFNPGVYQLQDPRTRVFNFDPYLQTIMPVDEFDFNALKQYVTSSKDDTLLSKAAAEKKKYTGSTSSMTASLAHFHFLLSQWRLINVGNLSKMFPVQYHTFTAFQRCPTSIFLRWKDGTYAIDADKQFDGASVLSMLGKSMEKLLTLPMEDFEKYRKGKSDQISEEERNEPEAFHYTTMGDFLMRSQLDAYDSRLPGTGMFDLKTRAVISVRMDTDAYEEGRGYQIRNRHGEWESFEREYYDMIRSAFLKYSLQVRMGRMDGIFVAFHNTERIFGFQYISLEEMDYALHGSDDRRLGDAEFKLSVDLLNRVLDRATTKFPEKSLRIHFETRDAVTPFMYIFAEPVEEDRIEEIQATNRDKAEEFERRVLGLEAEERNEQEKIAQWNALRARVERTMKQDEEAPEQQLEGAEDDADAMTEEERHQIQVIVSGNTLTEEDHEETERLADEESDELEEEIDGAASEDLLETEEADESEREVEEAASEDVVENDENTNEDDANLTPLLEADQDLEDAGESGESGEVEVNPENESSDVSEKGSTSVEESEEVEEDDENTESLSTSDTEDVEAEETKEEPVEGATENEDFIDEDAARDVPNPTIAKTKGMPHREEPLLAMTLTIRNLVDGEYVAQPDAENYPPGAKWDVEYALAEVQDRDRADLLYKACKLRRKRTYTNTVDLTANVLQDAFLERIKTLSREGRVWRDKQKEIEEKLPLRTLDETLQKSSEIRNEESNDDNDAHDEEGEGEVKS